jgi:hypothetical protein
MWRIWKGNSSHVSSKMERDRRKILRSTLGKSAFTIRSGLKWHAVFTLRLKADSSYNEITIACVRKIPRQTSSIPYLAIMRSRISDPWVCLSGSTTPARGQRRLILDYIIRGPAYPLPVRGFNFVCLHVNLSSNMSLDLCIVIDKMAKQLITMKFS